MRLKHLHLHGYKTFATKTEFLFPSGITAIVGPNGSGKSNVADAIRWVLGEQSYTALRGKRTEDMIFSGSQSRSRSGMAEVILTLDNGDGWLPVDFSEVTISRRAYRDGQNEYGLNNSRVRLRDISELLSQSGLSRRTYTIIGQGLVDTVLSLRAQERRDLFEEAAGIAHYQEQRADALRKMDETQHNLERVHDIVVEIEPRLKRLERQAERAQEHAGLSRHLDQLLHTWYGYRWGQAGHALDEAQRLVQQHTQQYDKRLQELGKLTARIDKRRQEQIDYRRRLGDWQRQSSRLHTQAEEGQRELAVLAERRRQLDAQKQDHVAEVTTLEARVEAQAQRVRHAQAKATHAGAALTGMEKGVASAQAALNQRLSARQDLQSRQGAKAQEQAKLRTELANRRSRLEALAEHLDVLMQQMRSNQAEEAQFELQASQKSKLVEEIEERLTALSSRLDQAGRAKQDLENQREKLAPELGRRQDHLRQVREAEADANARFEVLSQLRRDFAIYGHAARYLLGLSHNADDPQRESFTIHGVLAQMIQFAVDQDGSEVATAVEAALRNCTGGLVVDDWRAALRALDVLRSQDEKGRVFFLPLESPVENNEMPPSAQQGQLRPLSRYIVCDTQVRPLIDRLLGHAFLVADVQTAWRILPDLPSDSLCVTPDGQVCHRNGIIEGGQTAGQATSPIAQEQEWSDLKQRCTRLRAQREEAETAVERMSVALTGVQHDLRDASVGLDELKSRHDAMRTERNQVRGHVERLRQEIEWRHTQMAKAQAERRELGQRQQTLTAEIEDLSAAQDRLSGEIHALEAELAQLPTDALSQELTARRLELAAARETCEGQESILEELRNTLQTLEQERATRERRIEELEQEETEVAQEVQQISEEQATLTLRLGELRAQIEPAEERLEQLAEEQQDLEARERIQRDRLREFENRLTKARLNLQRREDELDQLRSRIEEDLGLVELEMPPSVLSQTPLPLHPLVSRLPILERLPEGLEDEIKRLRAQLRRLGSINPDAPTEFREAQQRYQFLNDQAADLTAAMDRLQEIITEMDGLIERAFQETFDAVATKFSEHFTALFGGGHAHLELTDPGDLTHTGVEIVAQPPGKRLQALTSLSGGERALTAVALIFAILYVSPTPFCILDEVDAMLDEANIGRFRSMLEALAEHTQFVVITHNRGTISAADTVYGISMGPDSASQVYSIRLEGEKIQSR